MSANTVIFKKIVNTKIDAKSAKRLAFIERTALELLEDCTEETCQVLGSPDDGFGFAAVVRLENDGGLSSTETYVVRYEFLSGQQEILLRPKNGGKKFLPFSILQWKTGPGNRDDDPSYQEFFPFPFGKKSWEAKPNEDYKVCLLASSYCLCQMIKGIDAGKVNNPYDLKNCEEWSGSSLSEHDTARGKKDTERLYREYFPGVIQEMTPKKLTKAQADKARAQLMLQEQEPKKGNVPENIKRQLSFSGKPPPSKSSLEAASSAELSSPQGSSQDEGYGTTSSTGIQIASFQSNALVSEMKRLGAMSNKKDNRTGKEMRLREDEKEKGQEKEEGKRQGKEQGLVQGKEKGKGQEMSMKDSSDEEEEIRIDEDDDEDEERGEEEEEEEEVPGRKAKNVVKRKARGKAAVGDSESEDDKPKNKRRRRKRSSKSSVEGSDGSDGEWSPATMNMSETQRRKERAEEKRKQEDVMARHEGRGPPEEAVNNEKEVEEEILPEESEEVGPDPLAIEQPAAEEPAAEERDPNEPFPSPSSDSTPPPPPAHRRGTRQHKKPIPDLKPAPTRRGQAEDNPTHVSVISVLPPGPPAIPLGDDEDEDGNVLVSTMADDEGSLTLVSNDLDREMPPLPPTIFASEEELEAMRERAMREDRALQQKKRVVNQRFKQIKEELLASIRMTESGEDANIDQFEEEVRHHLQVLREAAEVSLGQGAEVDELNRVAVEFMAETVRNLFYKLADANERIALLESRNSALRTTVQAGNVRRRVFEYLAADDQLPLFRDGEALDPDSPEFQNVIEDLVRKAGDGESDRLSLHEHEEVQQIVQFTKRATERAILSSCRGLQFPKFMLDYAKAWKGVRLREFKEETLQRHTVTAIECLTRVEDRNQLTKRKTKEHPKGKPVEYLYVHREIWMPRSNMEKVYLAMIDPKVNLKLNYAIVPKGHVNVNYRDFVMRSFFPVAEAVINAVLWGGVDGGEVANYYSTAVFPMTKVKLDAGMRYVKWAISYLVKEKVGTAEDYAMLSKTILFSINRWATKLRTKSSSLVVPNWRDADDPNYFVRFVDEVKNQQDEFICTFVDNENAYKDPSFLKALKAARARRSKKSMEDEEDQDDIEGGEEDQDETPRGRKDKPKFTRRGHMGHRWGRPGEAEIEDVNSVPSHVIDEDDRNIMHAGEQSVAERLDGIKIRNILRKKNKEFLNKAASKAGSAPTTENEPVPGPSHDQASTSGSAVMNMIAAENARNRGSGQVVQRGRPKVVEKSATGGGGAKGKRTPGEQHEMGNSEEPKKQNRGKSAKGKTGGKGSKRAKADEEEEEADNEDDEESDEDDPLATPPPLAFELRSKKKK